ncbi:hypothetical protein [Micromonospora echinofusca]|uniref:Uncharacterized protein n=1 Tax=Micromonospora echinofusca TaxID=47858 RepID=A0A1C5G9S8_MICEH|nr:hypothetical protein [Micromonospora echinofusca]SCG16644.1 hypothetical protein GA0070610_2916 [Micromonospora echinofusca]
MTEPKAQPEPQPVPQTHPETTDTAGLQPTPRKKPQVRWIIAGVAVLVLLLCFGGCRALLATTSGEEPGDGKTATSAAPQAHPATSAPTTAAPTTAPATTAPPAPTYGTPTKNDFKLKVKVLRKQCFGSAGCNITYRIDVTYIGDVSLDPSKTYEVTYQVKGAEDPVINTFEVSGDSASVQQEEMASTKRSGDKLTAVVTDVSEF